MFDRWEGLDDALSSRSSSDWWNSRDIVEVFDLLRLQFKIFLTLALTLLTPLKVLNHFFTLHWHIFLIRILLLLLRSDILIKPPPIEHPIMIKFSNSHSNTHNSSPLSQDESNSDDEAQNDKSALESGKVQPKKSHFQWLLASHSRFSLNLKSFLISIILDREASFQARLERCLRVLVAEGKNGRLLFRNQNFFEVDFLIRWWD